MAPTAGDGLDAPQAVIETSGDVVASYVFAGEVPLAKTTESGTEYYLSDDVGSVIGTADARGTLLSAFVYDAFGNEIGGAPVPSDSHGDFRLHGMWKDPSGLYYVHARSYDANSGRFTSRDPAQGESETPERFAAYLFGRSNPYVWTDPSGTVASSVYELGVSVQVARTLDVLSIASSAVFAATAVCAATYAVSYGVQAAGGTSTGGACQPKRFRVLLQAQGNYLQESWRMEEDEPISVAEGLAGLEILKGMLMPRDLRVREGGFEKAGRWISSRPPLGAGPPGKNGFKNRGVSGGDARVDIEIHSGVNFTY
jgi:RHS repeat-associated protein